MVALRVWQPRPALPDPNERLRPREGTRHRPATHPASAPGRQPRINLDGLAIGTPLTAALIGVLLTEGSGAAGGTGATAAASAAAAARRGDEAEGAIAQSALTTQPDAADEGGAGAGAANAAGGESLDPLSGAEASALQNAPSGGGQGGGLEVAGGSAAALDAKAPLIGAVNITIAAGTPLLGELDPLDDGSDSGAGGTDGRIGGTIVGTDGDDVIHGTPHDDRLFGGAGNDTIYGHEGDDLLDGGTGDDRLFGGPGDDELLGGSGHDQLHGGTGDDRLDGGTGNDSLFGNEGRDKLDGGAGDDLLDGGADHDRLIGGPGDDSLRVDNIHDVAFGDGAGIAFPGNNTLVVQAAFDAHLLAELGEDRAAFVLSENFGQKLPSGIAEHTQQVAGDIRNVTLQGTGNHDIIGDSAANSLIGNAGDNVLHGGGGDDLLIGNAGADRLHGGAGRDRLEGGEGDDVLRGGASDDQLYGGAGDDILDGGPGSDLLYGGAGDDNYLIDLNDSAIDTVFDHEGLNRLTIENGADHKVQTAVVEGKLYVIVDNAPIAIIDDYVGNEDAFAGIDTGSGLRTIDELMVPGSGAPPAEASSQEQTVAETGDADGDLLGGYLSGPSLRGTAGQDDLIGTSGSDWLQGGAGADRLVGGAGDDVLEGGLGNDLLEGGAGDDRYLLRSDEASWDIIRDTEGSNHVELQGFEGLRLNARVVGDDLVLIADSAPILTFEDYVGNEQAFAGVQVGDEVLTADDLLA